MTTVVHKSKPYGIYIGRQYSMLPQSVYYNPFHIGKDGDRVEVLLKFAVYWYAEEQRPLRQRARRELPYRILGCWCKPKACHGDIIAGYVNWREVMVSPTKLDDLRCEDCGHARADVDLTADPYDEDVNGIIKLRFLCEPCAEIAADEI